MLLLYTQMSSAHSEAYAVTADVPVLDASLLLLSAHLGDVISPSVNQLGANLRLADQHLTDSEENVENVLRTWNASRLELISQFYSLYFTYKQITSLMSSA